MSEKDIYEQAISNVNFIVTDDEINLFIFNLYEINNDNVKFFLSEENEDERFLYLHPPSDQIINIEISDEEVYQKLKEKKVITIFEIDWTTGDVANYYNASS